MGSFYCTEALSYQKAHEAFLKCVALHFSSSTAMAELPSAGTALLHGSHCKGTAINLLPHTQRKCSWPCFMKHRRSQGLRCFSVLQPFCMCTYQDVFQLIQTSRTPCKLKSHPTVVAVLMSVSPSYPSPQALQVCSLQPQPRVLGCSFQLVSTHQHSSEQTESQVLYRRICLLCSIIGTKMLYKHCLNNGTYCLLQNGFKCLQETRCPRAEHTYQPQNSLFLSLLTGSLNLYLVRDQ